MNDPIDEGLKRASESLERFLIIFLASAAIAVLLLGIFLMLTMGGGKSHLGGRLAIAVAAVLMLGLIDGHATKLANRRRPLLAADPPWYRRFVVISMLSFFGAAALLFGIALFLP